MTIVLLQKDDNNNIIHSFNVGEHILGRGNTLECNSKRVSRKHGLLKVTIDEGIFLKSTHNNPCFHQRNFSQSVVLVTFGNSIKLNNNDKIALSLDHGWFNVKIKDNKTDEKDTTSTNNITNEIRGESNEIPNRKRKFEEINELSKIGADDTIIQQNKELAAATTPDNSSENKKQCKTDTEVSINILTKKNVIEPVASTSLNVVKTEDTTYDEQNNQKSIITPSIKEEPDTTCIKQEPRTVKEESEIPEGVPCIDIDIIHLNQIKTEPPESSLPQYNNDVSNNSMCNFSMNRPMCREIEPMNEEEIALCRRASSPQCNNRQSEDDAESRPSTSGVNTNNNNRRPWRDRCWYGANCYRRNQEHRLRVKHPGDSDFDSDPDDSRPICCYGINCYRKNREHRKKYRHPGQKHLGTKPQIQSPRKRRTVNPPPKPQTQDSNEDDYDYSDPFINDDSSDEYKPTSETESEYEDSQEAAEDHRRLLREARKFTRNQK